MTNALELHTCWKMISNCWNRGGRCEGFGMRSLGWILLIFFLDLRWKDDPAFRLSNRLVLMSKGKKIESFSPSFSHVFIKKNPKKKNSLIPTKHSNILQIASNQF